MAVMDSFESRSDLRVGGRNVEIYSLAAVERSGVGQVGTLPMSLRVLIENLLRHEDGRSVTRSHIEAVAGWDPKASPATEIQFVPARVLLQDFTGVPAVVDLAAMREAFARTGGDPARINPLSPVDLVIDHSVQVDSHGTQGALEENVTLELRRNAERYEFLKWGQRAFKNMRVVPPGTGIVHQVNLEYLAPVVFSADAGGRTAAYPDSLVGTDSHTTMINGLGVLGWGVGGIEAEAAMLGQAIAMLVPQVVGVKVTGKLPEGATATDLVLTVTQVLRKKGVVGRFVEFFGPGLDSLSLPDRATIANMAPEYGATVGFFPVDRETIAYLRLTGRDERQIELVEGYCMAQGLFRTKDSPEPRFSDVAALNLGEVEPSLAGPKRPQDRVRLADAKPSWRRALVGLLADKPKSAGVQAPEQHAATVDVEVDVEASGETFTLRHGSVVIAAITSCTNTSNPAVMLGAGLLARKANALGLRTKRWAKTSLAPGSQVVTEYLRRAGLLGELEQLGFHVVGYGCTTCIGNSGPLDEAIAEAVRSRDLVVAAVLSGNRNFEGRIHPLVRANYLASPPLCVAYALAGTVDIDFACDPLGAGEDGKSVYLRDVWPSNDEIDAAVRSAVTPDQYRKRYARVFDGPEAWRRIEVPAGDTFAWAPSSTYIRRPTFFDGMPDKASLPGDITGARALAVLGDSVTTDHISPAGNIAAAGPASAYLRGQAVEPEDFNSYGARRGNHEVMVRGTFANIRLRNLLVPGTEGGVTRHLPSGEVMSIFDASARYGQARVPTIVMAGKEYGTGSSRDWAAKGPFLLGVRAVIAESYERIHRSNLIGMGILPLEFLPGDTRETLGLTGEETFSVCGMSSGLHQRKRLHVEADGTSFDAVARLDTPQEVDYYTHGGILQYVLRQLASS